MARFLIKRAASKGTRPGTLIFIGEKRTEEVIINVMQFDAENLNETSTATIAEALSLIGGGKMTWINIFGLHDIGMIEELGKTLGLDNLLIEDFLNTDHRPRMSQEEDRLFFITKLLTYQKAEGIIQSDQMSMIVGLNYVVTLQEKPATHFDAVRERIRRSTRRERIIYPDYLAYALLDCMVDSYMDLLADLGAEIDNLEKEILTDPGRNTSKKIYRLRTELNFLRRSLLPLKEVSLSFLKSDSPLVHNKTRAFLSDLHDHVILTHESVEVYYSLVADQLEAYNSLISNRANEIMKVLTIFAAFFIPLTFIAGIYGMNFEYIPELSMKNGYVYFWVLILTVAIMLTIYFKRKKWL